MPLVACLLQLSSRLPHALAFPGPLICGGANSNKQDHLNEVEVGMEVDAKEVISTSIQLVDLLRRFLGVQQRRASAYERLRRGFAEYLVTGGDAIYQQLCSEITLEFNDCSKQVLEMESVLSNPIFHRNDLADLLKSVQAHEKQKLHLQEYKVLKKAGRPSERLISHEKCTFTKPTEHQCIHVCEITEATGTEDAEADAEYDNSLNEAIRGVQDAVTCINEHLEEVRYEIDALEAV